jgi:hypothetical protein
MARKDAVAIDDISGFKVKYKDLKTQWDGVRTVAREFDEKHPQLTPATPGPDSRPLKDPRPDNDDDSGVPTWHLTEGLANTSDEDTQIEDVGRWTMHHGAKT